MGAHLLPNIEGNTGEVGAKTGRLRGCGCNRTTSSGADGHNAGGSVIGLDEVVASGNSVGGRSASWIGQGHRIVDLEAQVGADSDVAATRRESGGSQRGNRRTSRGVVQGAGGARKDGGHW